MKKTFMLGILFLVILCSLSVMAAIDPNQFPYSIWSGEGNVMNDFNSQLFLSYTGYASNRLAQVTNLQPSDYTICYLSPATQQPLVSFEFTNPQFTSGEIVIWEVYNNDIFIYNSQCELIQMINGIGSIVSQPQIIVMNNSVMVPVTLGVLLYRWDKSDQRYNLYRNYTNPAADPTDIICDEKGYLGICYLPGVGSTHTQILNLTSGNYYVFNNSLSSGAEKGVYPHSPALTYITATRDLYGNPLIPISRIPVSVGTLRLDMLDQSGLSIFTSIPPYYFASPVLTEDHSFVAKLGTTFKLFRSFNVKGSHDGGATFFQAGEAYIGDVVSSNVLLQASSDNDIYQGATLRKVVSNWAVGDYNKDGLNEACILTTDLTDNSSLAMKCYNSALVSILNVNVTGVMSANNLVMADFIPGLPTLSFATYEGIFYYNTTSHTMIQWASTSRSGDTFGHIAVTGGSAPFFIYTSSTEGFLVKRAFDNVSCGDGFCDPLHENELSCFVDCQFGQNQTQQTTPTYTNGTAPTGTNVGPGGAALCASGYIQLGLCTLRPGGHTCSSGPQCLSGVCSNGRCNNPSGWAWLDNLKKLLLGDDSNTNNLLALSLSFILAMAVAIVLAVYTKALEIAAILGGCAFMGGIIFFTIVGYLSPFILLGIIIISGLIITLTIILGHKGG
jgi:hypothetical protein